MKNDYSKSKKIWKNWRKAQKEDPIIGFCNWEIEMLNFKLECYSVEGELDIIDTVIFQFWPDGNGFIQYKQFN